MDVSHVTSVWVAVFSTLTLSNNNNMYSNNINEHN